MWTCPDCRRMFGRRNQGHMCSPALTLEEYFSTANERERPIFDAVMGHLNDLGDVHAEPVSVGIFFKNGPIFAELRPRKKWVAVCFRLPVKLTSARLSRKVIPAGGSASGGKYYHVVNVTDAADVDEELLDWLTESYFAADV